jgi:hypothetical protein
VLVIWPHDQPKLNGEKNEQQRDSKIGINDCANRFHGWWIHEAG